MSKHEEDLNLDDGLPLILIVEDNVDFLAFLVSEFEESYQVISASHGRDGLQLAHQYLPDLVVTDLMMPVMGGIELCKQLKANSETSHIPVVMLTSMSSVESQVAGLKTGADDYVTKPLVIDLLMARVANLLESRRILRERFSREFKTPGRPSIDSSPDQEFLQKAFDVLEEFSADEDFVAEVFAQKMGISLRTLHRKLKALMDYTPSKLIWNVRLKKAAELLWNSEYRITDVAYEVGFSESAHFSRMFRQYYGLSPSEYQAQKKKL